MENIIINREGKFRDETVSSIPLGINNINISSDRNFNLKKNLLSRKTLVYSTLGRQFKNKHLPIR